MPTRPEPLSEDVLRPTARQPARRANMGRPSKRQVDQRNKELLERALDLFLEKGFEGTTIQDITQSIGMSKRTVTARYGNKVALFKAALKRALDEWVVPEERLRSAESDDLEKTLFAVGRALADSYLEPANLRLACITNASSHSMPEISTYMYEQFTQNLVHYFADLFRRRFSNGRDFPDAEQFALTFLTMMGTPARILAWGVPLSQAEIDAHIAHSIRMFLDSLTYRFAMRQAAEPPA